MTLFSMDNMINSAGKININLTIFVIYSVTVH